MAVWRSQEQVGGGQQDGAAGRGGQGRPARLGGGGRGDGGVDVGGGAAGGEGDELAGAGRVHRSVSASPSHSPSMRFRAVIEVAVVRWCRLWLWKSWGSFGSWESAGVQRLRIRPPSQRSATPVMYDAGALQRNAAAAPNSSGSP